MFRKSEEEKAAEEARKQVEVDAQRKAAEATELARSPVGRATAARQEGRRLFQILLPLAALDGDSSALGSSDNQLKGLVGKTVLDEIESVGWQLEHVAAVFAETGATSSARVLSTGEGTVTRGTIYGLYVFRATETAVA